MADARMPRHRSGLPKALVPTATARAASDRVEAAYRAGRRPRNGDLLVLRRARGR